jgi:hypothetical protein
MHARIPVVLVIFALGATAAGIALGQSDNWFPHVGAQRISAVRRTG